MAVPLVFDGGSPDLVELVAFEGKPARWLDPTKVAPIGWRITLVCALIGLIDRIESTLLAGVLPKLQADLGISDLQAGLIPTAAGIAGLALLIPAGRMADRRKRTTLLAVVVASWSILTIGSAVATGFLMFFAVRMLLGAAGQVNGPPVASLIADAHPARGRAKAYGIERAAYFSGLPLGLVIGGQLAGISALGWRGAFLVSAVPGLVIAVGVAFLPEPVRGLGDRLDALAAERGVDAGSTTEPATAEATPTFAQLRALWQLKTLRYLFIGMPALFFGIGGIFYWLPSYLHRSAGMTEKGAAGVAGGGGGTGILIGIAIGAQLGDRFHRVKPGWRVHLGGLGLLGGGVAFVGALAAPALPLKIAGIVLACVGFAIAIPNLTAAVADVVNAADRGMGFASFQFLLTAGGALGPAVVGGVSKLTGSLPIGMYVLAVPMVAGAVWVLAGRDAYDADLTRSAGLT